MLYTATYPAHESVLLLPPVASAIGGWSLALALHAYATRVRRRLTATTDSKDQSE